MSRHFDLVVRGGLIYDGTGTNPFVGDVAIDQGLIVAVGKVEGSGDEEIDATGKIVTPGFVDIHTHYDGQATWSHRLSPSSNHGVTTIVMGNCGVGFAPCRAKDHDVLIELMEGVEDIPGIVIREGLPWCWETFPEYLDFLAAREFDMDVAAFLPHAPLRVFVMGERALDFGKATSDDIDKMREIAVEAMKAGALGFATSRSINHKSMDGRLTPSYAAAEDELRGITSALKDVGAGIFQMISDFDEPENEFAMIRRVTEECGRPLTFSLLQMVNAPDRWRIILAAAENAAHDGVRVTAQVCGRPVGVLLGLELSTNPFSFSPSYHALSHLPLGERLTKMRDPAIRSAIISEYPAESSIPIASVLRVPENMFLLGEKPNYEPDMRNNLVECAARKGLPAIDYIYDLLIEGEGRNVFYVPAANYVGGKIDAVETMLRSGITVPGLGDGGAHCGAICDASLPTYLLLRWTGECQGALSLPAIVKALSADTAAAVELNDRGRIAPGLRGDLNIIDLDALSLELPHIVYDLPSGAGRLDQGATGFSATIVAGHVTYRDGLSTGKLPGRLVRGNRPYGEPNILDDSLITA